MSSAGFTLWSQAGPRASVRERAGDFFVHWRRVTYGLALVGFLSLASTGEVNPLVILLFMGTWILGLAAPEQLAGVSRNVTRLVYWGALAGIGWQALMLRFESLLYLLFFLTLFKCLRLREPLDHLQAALLSFFMLLACSIITASISFLPFLAIFSVLMLLEMQCFTIGRERQNEAGSASSPGGTGLVPRLAGLSVLMAGGVLALAMVLFLFMPHYSPQRVVASGWARKPAEEARVDSRVVGYSDDLSLGVSGRFSLDNTVVMTVKPSWADGQSRPFPSSLHLRGMALDRYEGNRWVASRWPPETRSSSWRIVYLPVQSRLLGPVLRQVVSQNTTLTRRLFGASTPFKFDFGQVRGLERYPRGLILNWGSPALELSPWRPDEEAFVTAQKTYTVDSFLSEEATPMLRRMLGGGGAKAGQQSFEQEVWAQAASLQPELASAAGAPPYLDPLDRQTNVDLPAGSLMDRIGGLSRQQAPAATAEGKILQLLDWFRTSFDYSLEPDLSPRAHPIETFLFRSHKGHCEYFATGLALMLRAQSVPARVVIGFYTSEWIPDRGIYTVRQSDAHAWTEVWLDGQGWVTVDPTPPSQRGRALLTAYQPPLAQRIRERVMFLWRNYILDYSNLQQAQLAMHFMNHFAIHRLGRLLSPVTPWASVRVPLWGSIGLRWMSDNARWFIALAGLLCLWGLYRLYSRQHKRPSVGRSPVRFLNRLLDRLAALGWRRSPGQTVAEFLTSVDAQTGQRWQLAWLADQYHRLRWAGQPLAPEDQRRIHRLIDAIRS